MDGKLIFEYQWHYLLTFLPPEEQLDTSARRLGALTRRRQISNASVLLRVAFAYGFCGLTLRQTAAWAEVANIASVSDVALLKRLQKSADWLGYLLGLKLAEKAPPPPPQRNHFRIRLVDATTISRPGSKGTDWRIHLGFNLEQLAIDFIELTDNKGGETLCRIPLQSGDVIIGDRGYAHRRGLVAIRQAQGEFIIRLNWQNVPLLWPSGTSFDILNALRSLPDVGAGSWQVCTAPTKDGQLPSLPARLVAIRKTEAAAEGARRKLIAEHKKKGKSLDPRTLESASYIFLLTSLDDHLVRTEDVLELYRFRWQIELAFKRMKSLLDLGDLPARDPTLARSFLYSKLLAALLIEEFTDEFLAFSPWGYRLETAPPVAMAYSKSPS